MTWDSSWKDITDLDGLKRQPINKQYGIDLLNALIERGILSANTAPQQRSNVTRSYRSSSSGITENGHLPFFDCWNSSNTNVLKYFWDKTAFENLDPIGKTVPQCFPTVLANNLYATPAKFESAMGYTSQTSPFYSPTLSLQTNFRSSLLESRHFIYMKEFIKYNPMFCSRGGGFISPGRVFLGKGLNIPGLTTRYVDIEHRCRIYGVSNSSPNLIVEYLATIGNVNYMVESAYDQVFTLIDNIAFEYV